MNYAYYNSNWDTGTFWKFLEQINSFFVAVPVPQNLIITSTGWRPSPCDLSKKAWLDDFFFVPTTQPTYILTVPELFPDRLGVYRQRNCVQQRTIQLKVLSVHSKITHSNSIRIAIRMNLRHASTVFLCIVNFVTTTRHRKVNSTVKTAFRFSMK